MIKRLRSILRFISKHPLTRERKLKALIDFMKWQFGMKLLGCRFVVDWVDDAKFLTRKRETGLTGNLYCGFMEYEDMSFLLHYLRKSDVFYDIGANVGAYTILASAVRGCRSHTLEPLPDTFDRLVDQLKINRIEDLVDARNNGVGAKADVLEFTNTLNCMNRVNIDPNNRDVTKVEVIALDDTFDPDCNSMVKIDVEGYEKFVFDGGARFFSNPNISALIVELNDAGQKFGCNDTDIDETIRSYGFFPVTYDPMTRTLKKLDTFNDGRNTIYLRDMDSVAERCRLADKVIVHTAGDFAL